MAREISYRITVDDGQAKATVAAFDQSITSAGTSTATASTAVANLDRATASLAKTQTLATLSTEQLDAMIAGQTVALGTVTAATEAASVASGAYGSVLFSTAAAEETATAATVALSTSTTTLQSTLIGAVNTLTLWGVAAAVATEAVVKLINAHEEAAVKAETLAAKQDVINKALAEGAPKGISYGNAIKYVNEQEAHRIAMIPEAAEQKYIEKLIEHAKKAMDAAAEEKSLEEGLAAHGIVLGATINVQELMNKATHDAEEAARKHAAELKKLADEQERFRNSVKNLTTDAIGAVKGLGMYGQLLPDLSKNTAQFADQTIYLGSALDATSKDVETLERSGQFLSVGIMKINQELIKLPNVAPAAKEAIKQVNDEAARGHNILTGFADGLAAVWKGMSGGHGIGGLFENLGKGIIEQFGSIITGGITNLIDKGLGLLASGLKRLFGGPSGQELAGRQTEADFEKQFKSFNDMVEKIGEAYRTIGKSSDDARADVLALIAAEKQGGAAVQAVIDKIKESMAAAQHQKDLLAEASSKYGPSQSDLEAAEKHAHEIFDAMLAAGTYTKDQLEAAYYDWQKAMADAGNVAAQAWIKAHDAAMSGTKAATAEMQKLIDRRDELTRSISQEAPEAEMGVIEKQQRAERDAIEQQIKDAENAAQAKADADAKAAQDGSDSIKHAADDWSKYVEQRSGEVVGTIQDQFDGVEIHIPIIFDMPGLPVIPQASGGDWMVTKPTLFLAGEAGPERATFTPMSRPGGPPTSTQPSVMQVSINAVDARSFEDLVKRNASVIGHAAMLGVESGGKPMQKFRVLSRQVN